MYKHTLLGRSIVVLSAAMVLVGTMTASAPARASARSVPTPSRSVSALPARTTRPFPRYDHIFMVT